MAIKYLLETLIILALGGNCIHPECFEHLDLANANLEYYLKGLNNSTFSETKTNYYYLNIAIKESEMYEQCKRMK